MKQKRFALNTKKYLLAGVLVALVVVTIFVLEATKVIHIFGNNKQFTTDQKKEASTEARTKRAFTSDTKGSSSDTPGTAPTPSDITVTAQESDGNVTIMTQLIGYSGGTCKLTIANGSKTFSKSVDIIYQSQFSTCAGYSIPVSQLGAGDWSISITATTGDVSQVGTASLRVQ